MFRLMAKKIVTFLRSNSLLNWIYVVYLYCRPEYDDPRSGQEDTVRQTVMLGEEFLGLLITLLSKFFF